jgi:predicted AAA+ superfamily ATPase
MDSVARRLAAEISASLGDSPVVFIQGARQTGKSTLARSLTTAGAAPGYVARYLTLDDAGLLAAAQSDASGFIAGLDGPAVIDEVQRAPGLALAIKATVDADRRPGRFLLTGSANIMLLPQLSESLAGRMEIHTLWPLSQDELTNSGPTDGGPTFVDAVFGKRFAPKEIASEPWPKLVDRLVKGGYPEMLHRVDPARRRAWFESYITAILQRDIRDISNVRDLADMPRLLALAATRVSSLVDYADLSRGLAMPQTTLKRYMGLLEATFLIQPLPAWYINIGKRLVKSPKLLFGDTGLLTHMLGADAGRLKNDPMTGGGVLENFVAMELLKQRGWSKSRPSLFHFRTHNGEEVDLVLEDAAGRIAGIEVKASATVTAGDFKGLKLLASAAQDRFVRGIVLYTGATTVPFGRNLTALPVSALWNPLA